mmetsp:Transcript_52160/g.121734  ORF Transcript_52160/g.121734 Transcript_52160/m.121734 type:complete len:314 (-) Transcript_52160:65-1006(-)
MQGNKRTQPKFPRMTLRRRSQREAKKAKQLSKPLPEPDGPAAPVANPPWTWKRDQMMMPAVRIVSYAGTQGSGFVLATNENGTFVLTNHHVIRDSIHQHDRWDPISQSSKKVDRFMPVKVESFEYDERGKHLRTVRTAADIVAYSMYGDKWSFEGDLALVKLKAPLSSTPFVSVIEEEDFHEVRALDEVIMWGCPDASELPLPSTGHVASISEERAGIGLMLSQVFGNPGSSGSAVFRYSATRARYEVIAIHCLTDSRGSLTDVGRGCFLRLAIQAPEIRKFLRLHGLDHLLGTEAGQSNQSQAIPRDGLTSG